MSSPEANERQPIVLPEHHDEICRRLNLDLHLLRISIDLQEKALQDLMAVRNELASGGYEFTVQMNTIGQEQEAHVTRDGKIVDSMPLFYRATELTSVSPEVGFLEFENITDKTTLYVSGFNVEALTLDASTEESQEDE